MLCANFLLGALPYLFLLMRQKKIFYALNFFMRQIFLRVENCQNQIVVRKKIYVYGTCVPFPSLTLGAKKNYIFLLNNVLQIMIYYYVMFSAKNLPFIILMILVEKIIL